MKRLELAIIAGVTGIIIAIIKHEFGMRLGSIPVMILYAIVFFVLYNIRRIPLFFKSKNTIEKESSESKRATAQHKLQHGIKLMAEGKNQEAKTEFEKIIRLYPNSEEAKLAKDYLSQLPDKQPAPIEFDCPQCRKPIKAPPEHAGAEGECPHCNTPVTIHTTPS